ncbi:MAG: GNAT family N-acetyltransferase [Candidatus Methanosuratincola petrocarbonis]|nr:GNAT family N-acetyltransferase [Candidatus Methanosuratincola sp.]
MVEFRVAGPDDLPKLSSRILSSLDQSSDFYQENVSKFGIPEEYVKRAFSEGALRGAASKGSKFYLALEGDEILGFCQMVPQGGEKAELDRIVMFPSYMGKGFGSRLLEFSIEDQAREGKREIIVYAGRDERRARAFYEKNGFEFTGEVSVDAPWGKRVDLAIYRLEIGRDIG